MAAVTRLEAFLFQYGICIQIAETARKILFHVFIELVDIGIPALILTSISRIDRHNNDVVLLKECLGQRLIDCKIFLVICKVIDTKIKDYVLSPNLGYIIYYAL